MSTLHCHHGIVHDRIIHKILDPPTLKLRMGRRALLARQNDEGIGYYEKV